MPSTVEALRQYAVIARPDVGSNTFLLGRQTFFHGQVAPDLLELIAAYATGGGGGLLMVGGYMSFSGIDGKAGYGLWISIRGLRPSVVVQTAFAGWLMPASPARSCMRAGRLSPSSPRNRRNRGRTRAGP